MKHPRVWDLTLRIGPETLLYPGDPAPKIERVSETRLGDRLTATQLAMNCHVGTHIDAPAHFVRNGLNIDQYPAERFLGEALVVGIPDKPIIAIEDIAKTGELADTHVFFKTKNSGLLRSGRFRPDYTFLSPESARYLASQAVRSVGIDYYSLDPPDDDRFPAHTIIAEAGIPAYVCLDFSQVEPGRYAFCGMPLAIKDTEASPTRAILWSPSA